MMFVAISHALLRLMLRCPRVWYIAEVSEVKVDFADRGNSRYIRRWR
jgi:hypothetical protein